MSGGYAASLRKITSSARRRKEEHEDAEDDEEEGLPCSSKTLEPNMTRTVGEPSASPRPARRPLTPLQAPEKMRPVARSPNATSQHRRRSTGDLDVEDTLTAGSGRQEVPDLVSPQPPLRRRRSVAGLINFNAEAMAASNPDDESDGRPRRRSSGDITHGPSGPSIPTPPRGKASTAGRNRIGARFRWDLRKAAVRDMVGASADRQAIEIAIGRSTDPEETARGVRPQAQRIAARAYISASGVATSGKSKSDDSMGSGMQQSAAAEKLRKTIREKLLTPKARGNLDERRKSWAAGQSGTIIP